MPLQEQTQSAAACIPRGELSFMALRKELPIIGITMGDPYGIGPEVIIRGLSDPDLRDRAKFLIYGSNIVLAQVADRLDIPPYWWRVEFGTNRMELPLHGEVIVVDHPELDDRLSTPHTVAGPSRIGGLASLLFLHNAIRATRGDHGRVNRPHALVTAPICKESWRLAGATMFPGHTELLADAYGVSRVAMMFVAPQLNVVLATGHVPLMQLKGLLTIGRVFDPILLADDACRRWLNIERPRVAVCGLNPHASENGLFGDEEGRVITPAIEQARSVGIDASGPWPADTVFNAAIGIEPKDRRFDVVVAMYHDQGLIPIKVIARDHAVNVTLGLPLPRTSPDHGTAFDIAGKNVANAGSMRAAIEFAVRTASSAISPPAVSSGR